MSLIWILAAAFVISIGIVVYLKNRPYNSKVRFGVLADDSESPDNILDSVTGLYTRAHLLRRLQETMARADRDKKSIGLVMWDVDGFVEFNNEFGSKKGDRLLERVGSAIKNSVRIYDEVFRAGPDEFCALLIPSDNQIAQEVTTRVAEKVSKSLFEGDADFSNHAFSITAGFVFYPHETGRSPEAFIHAASQALYKSRLVHAGR